MFKRQCKKASVNQMLRAVLELPAVVHIQNFSLHLIMNQTMSVLLRTSYANLINTFQLSIFLSEAKETKVNEICSSNKVIIGPIKSEQ